MWRYVIVKIHTYLHTHMEHRFVKMCMYSAEFTHRDGNAFSLFRAFSNTFSISHTQTHTYLENIHTVYGPPIPHMHTYIYAPLPFVKGIIHFHILLPHTQLLSIKVHTHTYTQYSIYTLKHICST